MLEQDRKYIDNTGDIWNNTFLQISNVNYTSGTKQICNMKI
jgi:hypothetical protein